MGYEIIKVARDVDLYMEWSSIVDGPTFAGTRAEMLAHLNWQADRALRDEYQPPARLARADEYGTSSMESQWGHGWDSHGALYSQSGIIPRTRFEEFARAALADDEPAMLALLDPLD